jgi:ribosomal subunit interface protein
MNASAAVVSASDVEGTMEFVINGRNLAVSDRFREYATEKIDKIEQLGDKVQRIDAKITKETSARMADTSLTVELTVLCRGPVVRAEATAADKFAAFDLAYGKLLERLRRARDRRKVHHGRHTPVAVGAATAGLEPADPAQPIYLETPTIEPTSHEPETQPEDLDAYSSPDDVPAGDSPVLIRRKVFSGTPMTLDDAVDNMELVGHDFYLFIDSATGAPSVVYRRQAWTYGVITLDAKCAEGTEEPHEELLAYRAQK